ncbi:MAG: hypothetical protein IKL06_02065 [Lachnospiraceae bacterium]|nr:hypothetical protein [Lachnospiraceae bacterium]
MAENRGLPPVTPEEKKVNMIIAVVAMLIAIGLAIYSWQILPDQVANQPAAFDTGAPPIPKFVAVLLPFGISAFSAISGISYRKQFLICLVGYAMNVLFWISN